MPFLKSITAPNGASLTYHRIVGVEGQMPTVLLSIRSWPDEQAFIDGKPSLWTRNISYDLSEHINAMESTVLLTSEFLEATLIGDSDTDVLGARARRWASLKRHRDSLMYAPISYEDYEVDADMDSQVKMLGSAFIMQLDPMSTKMWRCTDNTMRELNLTDLLNIGNALASRTQALINTTAVLWDDLEEASTVEEIQAINWPSGE